MRRVRPEAIASVRQVRTAVLWAFAFSVGAALSALVVPLAVMHAVATLEGHGSRHTFGAILGVTLMALLVRGVFLSARSRVLIRAALWLSHALGAQTLAHGLDTVRSPNDLDRDRSSLDAVTRALPALGALFDAVMVIVPLALIVLLSPLLGLVALVASAAMLAVALNLAVKARAHFKLTDAARSEADGAWRTAAASSVVIAARGMTARAVAEWQTLNGRAIGRGYSEAQAIQTAINALQAIRHVALVTLLGVGVFAADGAAHRLGVFAAILLLHDTSLRTLSVGIAQIPVWLAAQRHLDGLMQATPHAFGGADAAPVAQASPVARPSPQRQAVAS
jgi:ABC-type protease/lipase transport system fused ATPase/permease subunit